MLEKHLERQILAYLNNLGNCLAWKNPTTGRFIQSQNKWIKTKGTITGVSDIIALYRRKKDGKGLTLFVEVKTKTGRLAENQEWFKNCVSKLGGYYYVVRCLADVSAMLEEIESI